MEGQGSGFLRDVYEASDNCLRQIWSTYPRRRLPGSFDTSALVTVEQKAVNKRGDREGGLTFAAGTAS